jgi:hypothetical protein
MVFVIDTSRSMNVDVEGKFRGPGGPFPRRIDVAKDEFGNVINALDKKAHFNLVAFASHVYVLYENGLRKKGDASIPDLRDFVDKAAGAGTNLYDGLMAAFGKNPEADTIFLVSDGMPRGSRYDYAAETLIKFRWQNRFRKVKVNTVAITIGDDKTIKDARALAALMRDLAEWNGGECKVQDKPPER